MGYIDLHIDKVDFNNYFFNSFANMTIYKFCSTVYVWLNGFS